MFNVNIYIFLMLAVVNMKLVVTEVKYIFWSGQWQSAH